MGERLIHDELEKQAYWHPEELAVAFEGSKYTYAAFDRRVNKLAAALNDRGVGPGDHLLAHGFDHVDWYTLFFACSKLGAVHCPVSKYQSQSNLVYITRELAPEFVFFTDDEPITDERLSTIRDAAPDATYVSLDGGRSGEGEAVAFDSFIEGYDGSPPPWRDDQGSDQIHSVLWTSGTTGRPKGVLRNHRSSLHFADNLTNDLPFDEDNVRATTNPMMLLDPYFHYGLPTFMVGGTVVVQRSFSAEGLYSLAQEYGVNSLHLGFTISRVMVEYLREHDRTLDLDYLTGVIPSSNMAESLYELTDELYQIYGTSEIGLPLVKQLEPPFDEKPALGKPGIGADIRIVSEDAEPGVIPTDPPEPGEVGQLVCRGETTMTRYLHEENQREHVHDGWIYPGDMVRINDQRDIVFMGRTDDRLRSGGVNVYPSEVENVLEEHPRVKNAVVVGVDDEKWGQRICALVVTGDDVVDDEELTHDLETHCKESADLAEELRPKEYAFLPTNDDVPTGAQEKEDRDAIRERFFES